MKTEPVSIEPGPLYMMPLESERIIGNFNFVVAVVRNVVVVCGCVWGTTGAHVAMVFIEKKRHKIFQIRYHDPLL